jgi:hypothetical protein
MIHVEIEEIQKLTCEDVDQFHSLKTCCYKIDSIYFSYTHLHGEAGTDPQYIFNGYDFFHLLYSDNEDEYKKSGCRLSFKKFIMFANLVAG